MPYRKKILLLLLLLLCASTSVAEDAKGPNLSLFEDGLAHYRQNRFPEAIACWEKLLLMRPWLLSKEEQLSLAINLAKACDRVGYTVRATRYAERAIRLAPDNKDVQNLANKLGVNWVPHMVAKALPAKKETIDRALFHYKRGEMAKAKMLFEKAAEADNSRAQRLLAKMYYRGEGIEPNLSKSIEWMTKAAKNGDVTAQMKLGEWYHRGIGVKKDIKKAALWFGRAADQGDPEARTNMGVFFAMGWGVKKDPKKAVELFRKAMSSGHAGAMHNLGNCYERGNGVRRNMEKAKDFYDMAAKKGHAAARAALFRIMTAEHKKKANENKK